MVVTDAPGVAIPVVSVLAVVTTVGLGYSLLRLSRSPDREWWGTVAVSLVASVALVAQLFHLVGLGGIASGGSSPTGLLLNWPFVWHTVVVATLGAVPVAWVPYVLVEVDAEDVVSPQLVALLCVWPLITVGAGLTNNDYLAYTGWSSGGGVEYGLWFQFNFAYLMLVALVVVGLLAWAFVRDRVPEPRIALLAVGTLAWTTGHFVDVFAVESAYVAFRFAVLGVAVMALTALAGRATSDEGPLGTVAPG